jgi:hypothetical protein
MRRLTSSGGGVERSSSLKTDSGSALDCFSRAMIVKVGARPLAQEMRERYAYPAWELLAAPFRGTRG